MPRIRSTKTVPDGHSGTEEGVYKAPWSLRVELDGESQEVTVGYGALGKTTVLSPSSMKRILKSLRAAEPITQSQAVPIQALPPQWS